MIGPETLLMFTIAFLLDTVGELVPYVSDTIGLFFIGGWILFRSQQVKTIKKPSTKQSATKSKTKFKKLKKWIKPLCIFGEFVPIVSFLPLWIGLVWNELRK